MVFDRRKRYRKILEREVWWFDRLVKGWDRTDSPPVTSVEIVSIAVSHRGIECGIGGILRLEPTIIRFVLQANFCRTQTSDLVVDVKEHDPIPCITVYIHVVVTCNRTV